MRGTREDRTIIVGLAGIIPAYAGNTGLHARDVMPVWDHPRVCGEHV